MSKFYILSEEDLNKMDIAWSHEVYAILRKLVLKKDFEIEFDGDLREFVKEHIVDEKRRQKLLDECVKIARPGYLLTPNELKHVLGKRALVPVIDDACEVLKEEEK